MKKVVFFIIVLFLLTTGVYLYYSYFHKSVVGKNIRSDEGVKQLINIKPVSESTVVSPISDNSEQGQMEDNDLEPLFISNQLVSFNSKSKGPNNLKLSETSVYNRTGNYTRPSFKGYIIRYKEKSVGERRVELLNKKESNINQDLLNYKTQLENKHQEYDSILSSEISNYNNKKKFDYYLAFNGVSLDINSYEVSNIKDLDFIESINPNYQVEAFLRDSIPIINADDVWNLGYTGEGIKIAIIDTGIDYSHEDLGGCFGIGCRIEGGYDFVNNDNDPMDDAGHGTHVAGTAAGNGIAGDNLPIKGVAPNATLYAYKVLNEYGIGYWSWILASFEYVLDPNQDGNMNDHLDIASMSFGSTWNPSPDDEPSLAVDNLVNNGVISVVAAGNYGFLGYETIATPGTSRKAITVGASTKQDEIAYYSLIGPTSIGTLKPDVVAPGGDAQSVLGNICSARYDDVYPDYTCIDNTHIAMAGTSMATPHVSGAAALIKQAHPDWNPNEIKYALRDTSVDLGYNTQTQGYGRINVLNAVNLEHKPPISEIFTSGEIYGTNINIIGTAISNKEDYPINFVHYRLYYASGHDTNSYQWTEICSSNYGAYNDILCNWDISLLYDGDYTLKLVVYGEDLVSEDFVFVNIENIVPEITFPLNNDIFRLGDNIKINGSIYINNELLDFKNYTIEYGVGEYPGEWFSYGINLINNGLIPIINGTLAYWDTSLLNQEPNFYTLRISFNFINGYQEILFIRNIYLDPTLKIGWPQRLGTELIDDKGGVSYLWVGYLEPVVEDINNDGYKEIIVYKGGSPPKIYVFNKDGNILNGWPVNVGEGEAAGGNLHIPLVGDIDNDGYDEIIVYNILIGNSDYSELYAFNHDGSLLWSVLVPPDNHPTMLMADLDLDEDQEIVLQGNDFFGIEKMIIVSNTGGIVSQWDLYDINLGGTMVSTPAIGNFDNDNELEIVVATPSENAGPVFENGIYVNFINEGIISVYNMDGSLVNGWPIYTSGYILSSPAVGDINNDNNYEIIVGLMYEPSYFPNENYGGLYAFDKNGNILNGWPIRNGYNFQPSPSLADFDNNGDLEIGISSGKPIFETYVIHHNGNIANGWPQSTVWQNYYSIVVEDVTNDGVVDIITTAGGLGNLNLGILHGGVYAWDFNGNLIEGFPKITEVDAQAPAVIKDIDKDGKFELIASSDWDFDWQNYADKYRGTIYVWELDSNYNNDIEWPEFHHDTQHTGLYPMEEVIVPQYTLTANPTSGNAPLTASFNLQGDFPINAQFRWHFGDEIITNSLTSMQHTYEDYGSYNTFVQILQNGQIIDVSNNVLIEISSAPVICSWSSWSPYTCHQTDMSNNQQQNCVGSQGCYPDPIVDIECEYAGSSFCKYNPNGPWKCHSRPCVNLNP